ncbi:PKD domain-containing protein [Ascidiimonas sp. W6]|uniref:PKD domain-containing protein n=1 Tax=Ascidiimonas meishanensis TaxID=3128903 RepID=UPI0030EBC406
MKQIFKGFRIVAVLILALAYVGCDDDDVILPQIEAGFTQTINQDTGTVTFINTSTNADTYAWDFGDGTTSTEINPIKSFPTGVYTVTLEASNSAGASESFEDVITISIPEVVAFPISFDNPQVSYEPTVFNGVAFQIVENPDLSGSNTEASNVAEIVNSGATFEGFFFELGVPLDLSTDKSVKIDFWSNTPINVLLKLEDGNGPDTEVTVSHGGTGWEEMYFTFDSSSSFSIITFFIDPTGTTAGTFYLDGIEQINTDDIPCLETELKLPVDFDCEGIDYATKIVGNVNFTVVDNPELSGINNVASKVGQITNVGANFENAFFNFDVPVDFTTDKGISLKMFSTQALPILLKFEDGTEGDTEDTQNHTGSGWEELTFTFNSTGSYNDMVLFVDGPGAAAGTFYVDDFEQVSGNVSTPCTPEMAENIDPANGDINWTFLTNDANTTFEAFGNTSGEIVPNPVIDAVNSSCNVEKFTKTGGCQTFAGLGTELATALDFTNAATNKVFTMKVLAETQVTEVTLRLERLPFPDTDPAQDRVATITQVGEWQELTFDFSDVNTGTYKSMIIYFERNQPCDGDVYYFDDIKQVAGGVGTTCTPETAENIDPANGDINWTFLTNDVNTTFEAFGNTAGEIVENPVLDAVNSSCNVEKFTKTGGCQTFAGLGTELATALDFTNAATNKVFTMKVLAETQVTEVTLRLERLPFPDTDPAQDRVATITQVGAWQELTFDFSDVNTGTYKSMIIYFERNQPCDGDVYYFDDIKQVAGSGGGGGGGGTTSGLAQNGDFETGDFTSWEVFENGGSITIDGVENNGGDWSGKIVATGSSAAGSNATLKQERKGAGVVNAGDTVQITFDYLGGATAPGAVINIQIFGEIQAGGVSFTENPPSPTFATTWTPYTYTFTVPNGADVSGGITLQFNSPCGAVDGCNSTLNLDNVSINIL